MYQAIARYDSPHVLENRRRERPHPQNASKTITFLAISFFVAFGVLITLSSISTSAHKNNVSDKISSLNSEKQTFQHNKWEYFTAGNNDDFERFPSSYKKFTVDLFSHPKVVEAFSNQSDSTIKKCFGPEENIVVYVNEDAISSGDGLTVFNLDCRDDQGDELIWFLMIIDMYGKIVAIHSTEKRVETVSVISSDTIVYSMINKYGSYLWRWQDDEHEKLPFIADSHSLIYHESDNVYYGFIPVKAGGSPDTVIGWGALTGRQIFKYTISMPDDLIHANYLSVSGEHLYIGLRDQYSLLKVNRETEQLEAILGGFQSDYDVISSEGDVFTAKQGEYFETWMGQHKFQIIEDQDNLKTFSLFNNNYRVDGTKQDVSNMMILHVHEDTRTAKVQLSFDTKEKAMIYGGCDILPFGGMLGNSYPDKVSPLVEDLQFHVNIWEITPDGDIAWRVGFKGNNPNLEESSEDPYIKTNPDNDGIPTGWNIMMTERFYLKPLIGSVCILKVDLEEATIQIQAFNSIRTQHEYEGTVELYQSFDSVSLRNEDIISHTKFTFERAFVESFALLSVPTQFANSDMVLTVTSPWEEATSRQIVDGISSLSTC